jgi:succinate dehydrogenase / fumarate reductase cytochrome b subunit
MGMKKMVTPCSVCLHSARKSEVVYKEDKYLRREVDSRLRGTQVSYKGEATAEHLVWVLLRDVGLERLKAQVKKPLKGLRVGAYYGCQMLRPQKYLGFEEPSRPKSMEQLIAVTGATPVTFSQATSCCGFPLLGSNEYMGLKLAYKVLEGAKHAGADLMAHPCSLCHLQLDMTQEKVRYTFKLQWRLPALYIAQLIGLSFGFSPDELQVPKGVTEVLESKGLA